jgi:hypothetical protein
MLEAAGKRSVIDFGAVELEVGILHAEDDVQIIGIPFIIDLGEVDG